MKKLIWVDDHKSLEEIYRPYFKKNGYEIVFASTIARGLMEINKDQTNFLLLDIQFPNSPNEGYIFLKEILKSHPNLKIILFSSFVDERIGNELKEKNYIIGYLDKPLIRKEALETFFEKLKSLIEINKDDSSGKTNIITIFIASSSNLKEERERIEQLLYRMNDDLIEKNIYLKTTIWEKESKKFTKGPKQKSFNKLVKKSHMFFCIVHDKVGKFTREEFDEAFKGFQENDSPSHLFVFFKDEPVKISEITSSIIDVIKMKTDIEQYEQFYAYYNSVDQLILNVKDEINKYLNDFHTS